MIKQLLKAHRLHFSAVLAANQFQIFYGDVQPPLAICHWVKFISKLCTLIKSNQFICSIAFCPGKIPYSTNDAIHKIDNVVFHSDFFILSHSLSLSVVCLY